jgi:hypothetical protein
VDQPSPKKSLEELSEERRRARWNAFWTPFITLASIVGSVGLLMFFARTCQERLPYPVQPPSPAPLKNRVTLTNPGPGFRAIDSKPDVSLHGEGREKRERMTPAQ